jgi:Tfp pilus assembly protein PilN
MIKVNLIVDHSSRTRKIVVAPTVSRVGLVYAAVFALALAGIGAYWHQLDREINALTQTRDQRRIENARLQELKKKITELEKLKQLHQSRIEVIEKLKNSQSGPVLLLSDVIKSIPREGALWLTGLDQKGDHVQIAGYAQRGDVIPDFMSNLSQTGIFKSVELLVLQEEKDAAKFSLVCITAPKVQSE